MTSKFLTHTTGTDIIYCAIEFLLSFLLEFEKFDFSVFEFHVLSFFMMFSECQVLKCFGGSC